VPFLEGNNPYNNVIKDLEMHYELIVAEDRQSRVHNKLIDVLREICRLPPQYRDFSRVGLSEVGRNYLVFSGPISMPNYVWFDGRVVIVRFLRIGERRKDRLFNTETFWKDKIRFYPKGEKLPLSNLSKLFAADFMKRLEAGEFKRLK
jgi:hypothetical protein